MILSKSEVETLNTDGSYFEDTAMYDGSETATPASSFEPSLKLFPTTPGSNYATPQPALNKKPSARNSAPSIASVTLVSFNYSTLLSVDALPSPPLAEEEWFCKDERAIIYTMYNRVVPWSNHQLVAVTKGWILEQKKGNKSCNGIEASLLWHWQTEISSTCFSNWYDPSDDNDGAMRHSKVIKDILRGMWKQKATNNNAAWLFDYVQFRASFLQH